MAAAECVLDVAPDSHCEEPSTTTAGRQPLPSSSQQQQASSKDSTEAAVRIPLARHPQCIADSHTQVGPGDSPLIDPVAAAAAKRNSSPAFLAELRSRLTTYRVLCTLAVAGNLGVALPAMAGTFPLARRNVARIAVANILLALLTRNELAMRAAYWAEVALFRWRWVPAAVKHCVVSVQHNVGGVHSGTAMSSVLWLAYLAATVAVQSLHHHGRGSPWWLLLLTCLILALLLVACASAYPALRASRHELFENLHRYCGWASLAALWCLVLLTESYHHADDADDNRDRRPPPPRDSATFRLHLDGLLANFDIWCTAVATVLVVLPWAGVRKLPVRTQVPGSGTMLIHFPGGVGVGLLGRISRAPMLEWHAFAIVSAAPRSSHGHGHLMMVSAVGDFTKQLMADPPNELYVRTVRFASLLYLAQLYARVVMVATGTGVSPMLSNVLQHNNNASGSVLHLVWVGRNIRRTFGDEVWEMVHRALPPDRLTVVDTAEQGRPDMVALTCRAVEAIDAQVVFVGSNRAGTKLLLDGCRAHGIICFGPLWDS